MEPGLAVFLFIGNLFQQMHVQGYKEVTEHLPKIRSLIPGRHVKLGIRLEACIIVAGASWRTAGFQPAAL